MPPRGNLLLLEGHAIGALLNSGIALVGAHQDAVQRAVVGFVAMVSALPHGALNALVCFAVHERLLLFS